MAVVSVNSFPFSERESPTIPLRVSSLLADLQDHCSRDDLQSFQKSLKASTDDQDFDRDYLSCVVNDAIRLKRAGFVKELLSFGLPMWPHYSVEAVFAQAKDVLEIFLDHGWDINQPIGPENPPVLGYAVQDLDITRWLLEHGADPNQQCEIDHTPLSNAVQIAPLPIINLHFDHGGDVSMGQLLHHAIMRESDSLEVVKLLIDRGADVNAVMYRNHQASFQRRFFMAETPLHTAIHYRKLDVIHYLLNSGADGSIKDAKGQTAAELATRLKVFSVEASLSDL